MSYDPLAPIPSTTRCGECGQPLWPIGSSLFCANPPCSMWGRESTDADKSGEIVPAWDFGEAARKRAVWHEQRDKELKR